MSKVEKISIALTADMADMLRQAVANGDYASSSEVVREALRDWKQKQADLEHLRELVRAGHASGSAPWEGADALIVQARARRAK